MSDIRQILSRALELHRQGDTDAARRLYLQVLEQDETQADALNLLGVLALQGRRYEEAMAYLRRAVDSAYQAEYLNNLGLACRHSGRLDEAQQHFEAALEIESDHPDAAVNLATLWQQAGRIEAAFDLLDSRYPRAGNHPQYLYNFATVCREVGQPERARELLERLLQLAPNDTAALFNHAMLLKNAGEFERAQAAFEILLGRPGKAAKARWFRSQCLLLQGNFSAGWKDYATRFDALGIEYRGVGLPEWMPGLSPPGALLVFAEQGVGDELLFATHIPALLTRCERILYECDARLRPLLQRSYPDVRFFDRSPGDVVMPADARAQMQCAAGDLIRFTNPDLEPALAGSVALVADRGRADSFELPANGRLNIGLSYYTGGSSWRQRMPPESFWQALLQFEGRFNLIDLQSNSSGSLAPPRCLLEQGMLKQIDGIDLYQDLDGLAALISRLDHVISIDNAAAHLAGSLAVPTSLLLSSVHDWRWLSGRAAPPWYPRMRLLRQSREGDWRSVERALLAVLRQTIQSK